MNYGCGKCFGALVTSLLFCGATLAVEPAIEGLDIYAHLQGDDAPRLLDLGEQWLEADQVTRIEVRWDDRDSRHKARAHSGDKVWQLKGAGSEKRVVALKITREIRESWQEQGDLAIELRSDGAWRTASVLRPRPGVLEWETGTAEVVVMQRTSRAVPGTHGYIEVRLGDITAGQVLLTMQTAEGKPLIETTSVGAGDLVRFEWRDNGYELRVEELVNVLIGDDFARLQIAPSPPVNEVEIEQLLDAISESSATFIRHEQEYTGEEAADHFRDKLTAAGDRVATLDEFIDQIASHSSLTGEPYLVQFPDGTTIEARDWLEQQAARLAEQPEDVEE